MNSRLSGIGKFNYLKNVFRWASSFCDIGIDSEFGKLSGSNRSFRKQIWKRSNFDIGTYGTLLNVNKVRNFDDTIALRKLYNDVETCVRNLKTLNVEAVTYGYLFIPIIDARLPDALVMIIARNFGENIWTLDLVLKYFHEELIAKEACFSHNCLLDKEKGHKNFSDNERSSRNSYYSQKVLRW